jgi:hypothetical protein
MNLNSHALKLLNEDKIELAFQILLKCQEFHKKGKFPFQQELVVLTYNHLACCYRRVGHPKLALKILEAAKRLLFEKKIVKYKAMTYLNLSAILSFLNK